MKVKPVVTVVVFAGLVSNIALADESQNKTTASYVPRVLNSPQFGFHLPLIVRSDDDGNVWVGDLGNLKDKAAPSIIKVPALNFNQIKIFNDPKYQIAGPVRIAIDNKGSVWSMNGYSNEIPHFVKIPGNNPDDPKVYTGVEYQIFNNSGITTDSAGNVWMCGSDTDVITEIPVNNPEKPIVYNSIKYQFSGPDAIAVDKDDNVWVANSKSNTVTLIPATNRDAPKTFGGDAYRFNFPNSIAVDKFNNVWVTNMNGDGITEIFAKSHDGKFFNDPKYQYKGVYFVTADKVGNVWTASISDGHTAYGNLTRISSENPDNFSVYSGKEYLFHNPMSIALDIYGNIWVQSFFSTTLTELVRVQPKNAGG